ncbi:type VI secretion system baseplate subunit TssE (plasmid) [Paraburkholderia sprentiae WSM5005]|uniref:Type VI secretion system baseplate subunit TssE n=1 Tax=Paraburkholderia sprentiae WSM5005 TaxID=754502 RepID=A0A1I9YT00_9BURK|nr:type VI secretion system baseplate subunit TssE [Paraburkholderia sprentiae]APA90025.1 type VI secretion system baseplate subunit TssE [Paraburkholderia sprentiae WSM5005]
MNTSDVRHRQAYMPSLIDRLLDDAPARRSERPDVYAPNSEGMRRIVQRDLSLLLNTTNLDDEMDMARYPLLATSVVNYGVPALSGGYLTSRNWETVETMVRTAIVRFEPRLIPESLRIRPLDSKDPVRYNQLIFEIHGLMHWTPYPLEFRIQSAFDIEMNHVTFDPNAGGGN